MKISYTMTYPNQTVTKLKLNYCIWQNQNDA